MTSLRLHTITTLEEIEALSGRGVLSGWDRLVDLDPAATFFQSRLWCLTWYRHYADRFEPLVLAVAADAELVGLVTLAVERVTGRLAFAGDNMSDYRDVVAAPGLKDDVVRSLLTAIASRLGRAKLAVGPTAVASTTPALLTALTRPAHVRAVTHLHPCWRLKTTEPDRDLAALRSKQVIRRHSNHYRRLGPLLYRRIRSQTDWEAFRQVFFEQHSLRRLYADQEISFDDPRKRAFYGALLASGSPEIHFSVLTAGEAILAFHFGFLHKATLYWGAPAFDVREQHHSPGLLLLVDIIADAFAEGCGLVDFTLGTEPFKARFGNECVDLPIVDLYASRLAFARRLARDAAVVLVKRPVVGLTSEAVWERAKDRLGSGARDIRRGVRRLVHRASTALMFRVTPPELREAPASRWVFHRNELGDLLRLHGRRPPDWGAYLREVVARLRAGETFDTVLVDEQLAGAGLSRLDAGAAVLHSFFTPSEWRERGALRALIWTMMYRAFDAGASAGFIYCRRGERWRRAEIESVGFRLVGVVGRRSGLPLDAGLAASGQGRAARPRSGDP